MRKIVCRVFGIICATSMLFASCSFSKQSNTNVSKAAVDMNSLKELADELANDIKYDYPLAEVLTEDSFDIFFNETPEGMLGFLYLSSTSSAEMVAVMNARSEADAKAMQEQLNDYMDDEYKEFLNYGPLEAKKLERRIVVQKENILVVSVSTEPDKATKKINDFFEGK